MKTTKLATLVLLACMGLGLSGCATQQPKTRIERAADLPRFSYPVQGDLLALLNDPGRFSKLSQQAASDASQVLERYDITERATQRQYLGLLAQVAMLDGQNARASALLDQIGVLQDKPADKLLSGLVSKAMLGAIEQTGGRNSPAYAAEVGRRVRVALNGMPFAVIENDVKRAKASTEFLGPALATGRVREVLQPVVNKTGALSSDMLPSLIGAQYTLRFMLPLKDVLIQTYGDYLRANQQRKPDIWAERDVQLPPGRAFKPVVVAVWDSGVDTALFGSQGVLEPGGKPSFIAFDRYARSSTTPLLPIPTELQTQLPQLQLRAKGMSDAQSNIDSPEAEEAKRFLSGLSAESYKQAQEAMRLTGVYQHGTHVAGIAVAGNPYAHLLNGRIEFGHTLLPDPCPSLELEQRSAKNFQAYVDFFRERGARVVNMSWGGNVRSYESALELCGLGGSSAERKALARSYFQIHWDALQQAMASAPGILFVASAGNSANDPSFNEAYPSSIRLPNLITVGAVDLAGDEAPFTSYGPTVVVHANGYQVESFVPGGRRMAMSGTSMSAPQVTNLAAKMIAVKPDITSQELIKIIQSTGDKTADGRRNLMHPRRALEAIGFKG